ncbi:transporter substrate-binding domain-containing protein [Paraburkholderia silvatlantica]|uniref:Amino acid ABC transporter substrate-binding protein (PAAT family) n=1 Tax=Paraburkholderia silvatlantica TaxID=321895 RepID=A0A2U1A6E4_9BURK|nr:transporter substrate-binding domain-containing protein [Paraburkholderia silvatlantica]MBB2927984.1 polar amino acid transport system substrate-binding protein [Paraburkholderia silvatlantica]PVY27454.1 amino acid ABC transporter substrate-binding protein (PAAT family) [Paraburkholderia silvatlantica]PXW34427.1 amino acid ABC transporter substrate-binding protein (PAAT family) [Paraburkholderia silvatlantica]PYE15722.1 amino acid ABC transporter substrate-binding protein (PAAT family) [Para
MKPSMMLGRMLAATAAAVALLGPVSAHARTLDEILASKKIVFGINPNLPPLGTYDAKNNIDGFDVSVARKIAEGLGVKLEIVPVGSNDRIPFLMTDKIDAVMGGMTRNADRMKVIDFTDPVNTEVLGVLTTRDKPYKDWTQLNDPSVRLVQVRGTTPVKLIQDKLPKAQLLLLDNYPDAVRSIAQGRSDALIDVLDFMLSFTKQYPVKWRVVDSPIEVDYDCIGVKKGNTALTERLNKEIGAMQKSGYIAANWKTWFGSPMLYDPTAAPPAVAAAQ